MSRRWLFLMVAILILTGVGSFYAVQQEARLYAIEPARGKVAWSTVVGSGTTYSYIPTVSAGQVYVWTQPWNGRDELQRQPAQLRAFYAASGATRWVYEPAAPQTHDLPALAHQQTVFTVVADTAGQAQLTALDASNGQVRWQVPPAEGRVWGDVPTGFGSEKTSIFPLGPDVLVFSVINSSNEIFAERRNWQTGALVWGVNLGKNETAFPPLSANVVTTDTTVAVNINPLLILDGATGQRRFSPGGRWSQVLLNDTLYASFPDGLRAFDLKNGQQRWFHALPEPTEVLEDRTWFMGLNASAEQVYGVVTANRQDDRYVVVALDAADGRMRWSTPIDHQGYRSWSRPQPVGDVLIVDSFQQSGNKLVALNTADGKVRWTLPIGLQGLGIDPQRITSDGQRIFAADREPRWRTWLAMLNQAWR